MVTGQERGRVGSPWQALPLHSSPLTLLSSHKLDLVHNPTSRPILPSTVRRWRSDSSRFPCDSRGSPRPAYSRGSPRPAYSRGSPGPCTSIGHSGFRIPTAESSRFTSISRRSPLVAVPDRSKRVVPSNGVNVRLIEQQQAEELLQFFSWGIVHARFPGSSEMFSLLIEWL